jgi:hypothetical protein
MLARARLAASLVPAALVLVIGGCYQKSEVPLFIGTAGAESSGDDAASSEDADGSDGEDTHDDAPVTTAAPSCGDGSCDPSEDCSSCPSDCNVCPETCGDGQCDPSESCGSCEADCGACCGNDSCDAAEGESWASCWRDCSDDAPRQAFDGIYGGCTGQTEIFDGPESDALWVRSDTHALMYVDGDEVYELSDTMLVGDEIQHAGDLVGTIGCHHDETRGCMPVINVSVYPDTGGESVPCLFAHLETLDFTVSDGSFAFAPSAYYAPCSTLCGNAQCDDQEIACGVTNVSHDCPGDCGMPDGCPACA